jgi:hypothetical protein
VLAFWGYSYYHFCKGETQILKKTKVVGGIIYVSVLLLGIACIVLDVVRYLGLSAKFTVSGILLTLAIVGDVSSTGTVIFQLASAILYEKLQK